MSGSEIKLISKTQRIVVNANRSVSVVNAGPMGPPGIPGLPGATGANAGKRWYGEGEPGVIIGAQPQDEYLDTLTGNLYILQ